MYIHVYLIPCVYTFVYTLYWYDRYLIDHSGADVDITDKEGATPLSYATRGNRLDILR